MVEVTASADLCACSASNPGTFKLPAPIEPLWLEAGRMRGMGVIFLSYKQYCIPRMATTWKEQQGPGIYVSCIISFLARTHDESYTQALNAILAEKDREEQ